MLCGMDMTFQTNSVQVKETYNGTVEPNPSYISTMASPMRRKHRDDILVTKTTQEDVYNAWEEDIALVNIFFGKETVMGTKVHLTSINFDIPLEFERSIRMGPVDFIASRGGLFGLFLGFSIVSFVEIIYWIGAGVFRTLFSKI